jgi:hypothetical protein
VWTFGASVPGVITQDFGKDAQYGTPDLSYYGGTLIRPVQRNPGFSAACRLSVPDQLRGPRAGPGCPARQDGQS